MARRVDDVDPVLDAGPLPEAGGGGGGDGDAPLLLLLHPVHGGRALMDLADLVVLPRVIEDALGRSRLPGIDVRHDADVAITIERGVAGHGSVRRSHSVSNPVQRKSGATDPAGTAWRVHPVVSLRARPGSLPG